MAALPGDGAVAADDAGLVLEGLAVPDRLFTPGEKRRTIVGVDDGEPFGQREIGPLGDAALLEQ